MHVHRLTRSNFRRLCDFTRKCRTWRKTLLSRRLINPEQAQRRTLAYDRLTRPVFRLVETLGTSLVTVDPTVITLNRFKVRIISCAASQIINWWCFVTMLSQSAATISSKCQHIKHTVVLALMFCTSERCTWTGHMCCSLWTAITRSLCTCLHEAATDELGSAAYCIIILAEMNSAPFAFGRSALMKHNAPVRLFASTDRGRTFVDFATSHASVALGAKHC